VAALLAALLGLTGCTMTGAGVVAGTAAGSVGSPTAAGPASSVGTVPSEGTPPAPAPGPTTPAGTTSAAPSFSESVVQLAPGTSDEASGIAASSTVTGAYFLVDDGSGTGDIVAVGSDGGVLARIGVDGMAAGNAEALAAGPCGSTPLPAGSTGQSCVYVGDIGDNKERREDIAMFRLAEPDLTAPPADPVPANEWRYTYPDGPHNAEAILLDRDGSLLVVTKPPSAGGLPHRMYRAAPGGGQLTFVREFRPPAAERPLRTLFTGTVVTDLGGGPGRVLLLTYDEVQEFTAPDQAAELSTFPDWPHHRLPLSALPQAEGITAAADGCGFAVASEAGPGGHNGSLAVVACG